MTPLFKKLQYKNEHTIVVLNAPASFTAELKPMKEIAKIVTKVSEKTSILFMIAFATKQHEIDAFVEAISTKLDGDAKVWFCYPKGSSKKYICDFNRDTGWASVAKINLEPVRQIAIDEDWSALRFRKVGFIKKITRREEYALTKEAKARTTQKTK
jgi:tRNA G10  N-methylase Trm11